MTITVDYYKRLARIYRAIEFLAFGRDLERARFRFLDRLQNCESILILGEGDGRCLAKLLPIATRARIHCLDRSRAMLNRTAERLASDPEALKRVTFREADAMQTDFSTERYDAVVTLFFLDCFSNAETEALVKRIQPSLSPGGKWLFADFDIPQNRGFIARWRARIWLWVLILFFRWQTKHHVDALPASIAILLQTGFAIEEEETYQWGLVRSALFSQPGSRTRSS